MADTLRPHLITDEPGDTADLLELLTRRAPCGQPAPGSEAGRLRGG